MDIEQRISKFGMKLEKANTVCEKELEEWKAEAAPEQAAADAEGPRGLVLPAVKGSGSGCSQTECFSRIKG